MRPQLFASQGSRHVPGLEPFEETSALQCAGMARDRFPALALRKLVLPCIANDNIRGSLSDVEFVGDAVACLQGWTWVAWALPCE